MPMLRSYKPAQAKEVAARWRQGNTVKRDRRNRASEKNSRCTKVQMPWLWETHMNGAGSVTEMEFSMTRDYNSGTDTNVHTVETGGTPTVDNRKGADNRQGVDNGGTPTVDNSSVRSFTISYSSQFQNRRNTSYPFNTSVTSPDDLKKLTRFDHVAAVFKDGINTQGNTVRGYRNKKCFQSSDVIIMDCDNTPTDPLSPDLTESMWKTPADVEQAFPDVQFYIVYSRNQNPGACHQETGERRGCGYPQRVGDGSSG